MKGQPLDPHPALMPRCTCGDLPEVHKPVTKEGVLRYGPCTKVLGETPCGCLGYVPEVSHG